MYFNGKWIARGRELIKINLTNGDREIAIDARCDGEEIPKGRRYF